MTCSIFCNYPRSTDALIMWETVGQWQNWTWTPATITYSKSQWMLGRLLQCLKSKQMSDGETKRKESSSNGSAAAYKEPEGEHWETQRSDPWRSVHKWCCFLFPDRQHGMMPPTPVARALPIRSVTTAAPSQRNVRVDIWEQAASHRPHKSPEVGSREVQILHYCT